MIAWIKRRMEARQMEAQRVEYWEHYQHDLENALTKLFKQDFDAERNAAAKRKNHKSHFWMAVALIAGCIGIGYVIGAVWGNV